MGQDITQVLILDSRALSNIMQDIIETAAAIEEAGGRGEEVPLPGVAQGGTTENYHKRQYGRGVCLDKRHYYRYTS